MYHQLRVYFLFVILLHEDDTVDVKLIQKFSVQELYAIKTETKTLTNEYEVFRKHDASKVTPKFRQ